MFDIGWSELVVIGVVALIAIGPKELPGVLRSVGFWMGKVRRMAAEFQGQFQEAMREAEMADLKKHADDLNTAAQQLTSNFENYDPLKDSGTAKRAEATASAISEVPDAAVSGGGDVKAAESTPLTEEAHVAATSEVSSEAPAETKLPEPADAPVAEPPEQLRREA